MSETAEHRSRVMRSVKSSNTQPEILVRSLLHRLGYRYRLHRADLPGKPDIVFSKRRKVIFIHGCFWHGHDCTRGSRQPKNNADYWRAKIARNKSRDQKHIALLEETGWAALVLWECELKAEAVLVKRLTAFLGESSGLKKKRAGNSM